MTGCKADPRKSRGPARKKAKHIESIDQEVSNLLEEGSLESITKGKQLSVANLKYQWDFYSELAFQRNAIVAQLQDAISDSCIEDYEFESWQRALQWKYSNHPLCTIGSLKQYGGRFNIGEDVSPSNSLQTFPAFYIAQNQDTARAEAFGSQVAGVSLTSAEVSLTNERSNSCISISGSLDRVIDLTKASSLTKFVRLMSGFSIPKHIYESAKNLNISPPTLINSPKLLLDSFMSESWRMQPAQCDIPANSQIFGQLAYEASIDGVLYKSSKTKKLCLAIFPSNFINGNSFMKLDDEPPEKWIIKQIDFENFDLCNLDSTQIRTLKKRGKS